jgi:DNA-binding phage protein
MVTLSEILRAAITRREEEARARGERVTISSVARDAGVDRSTLSRMVHGHLRGRMATVLAVADALGLDAGEAARAACEGVR